MRRHILPFFLFPGLLPLSLTGCSEGYSPNTYAAAAAQQQQRQMFKLGAKLWPVYCAQCHNARPGSEFSPAQWDVIMMHMRTQANLPANDARAMTEYLKRSH